MSKERHKYILDLLEEHGEVSVADLSESLQLSAVTIRSDLRALEKQGLLKRTHGGATKDKDCISIEVGAGNVFHRMEDKKKIADQAFSYIRDNDTIIMDDSSMNYYLAKRIREERTKHLIVITNSLSVATILSGAEHIVTYMTGGQIGGKFPAAMGDIAVETIRSFKANKAFISAYGINFDVGITSIGSPQLQVKKAILEVAEEIYVMVDSTKFGGGYVMAVCPFERLTKIITDDGLSQEYRKIARDKHIDIDIV